MLIWLLLNPTRALSQSVPGSVSVPLAWDASPSPEVTGYRVYRGPARGNYSDSVVVGNVTTHTVSGLSTGVTYFFAVTAYEESGLESDFSNEISYSVPGGPPPVLITVAPNGQVGLTVSGKLDHTYEILATQTLTAWEVIGAVTLENGSSASFTDPNAAAFPARYYRARDLQPDG